MNGSTVIQATIEAVGRTGAREMEIGHLDDDPPSRWFATAVYEGAKVSCDNQPGPLTAVLGLYAMLAAGAICAKCSRTVALEHNTIGLVDGARMRGGTFESRRISQPPDTYCIRRFDGERWSLSCQDR